MKKSQKIETKVYELLGVKLFRKAAFKLEKIVHRKDKGKNTNYHIQKNEVNSLGEFRKYLYYNGAIHTSNLIKGIPLLALMFLLNIKIVPIIILSTLLIKDAYCVMLQRYNWIKLSEKEKLINKKKQKQIKSNTSQYRNKIERDFLPSLIEENDKQNNSNNNFNLNKHINNNKEYVYGTQTKIKIRKLEG